VSSFWEGTSRRSRLDGVVRDAVGEIICRIAWALGVHPADLLSHGRRVGICSSRARYVYRPGRRAGLDRESSSRRPIPAPGPARDGRAQAGAVSVRCLGYPPEQTFAIHFVTRAMVRIELARLPPAVGLPTRGGTMRGRRSRRGDQVPSAGPVRKGSGNGANLGFEATLWRAADKLRNNMDAAEYKHRRTSRPTRL
jgi:hypothetical protein